MDSTNLIEALRNCQRSREGTLGSLDITDEEFLQLVIPMFLTERWTKLQLCENSLTDEGVVAFVQFVMSASPVVLYELDLGWNQVTDVGVQALASLIPRCSLRDLVLHSNEITDEGVRSLAVALRDSTVQTLDLHSNLITNEGANALAAVLGTTSLQSLDLSLNQINNDGARNLLLAMRRSTLTLLNLHESAVNDALLFSEIEKVEELVRGTFRIMITLCSARFVPRLASNSPIRTLPVELIRRIAGALYSLMPLEEDR